MNTSTNHLTTEQIYELLERPEAADTHLRDCAECQQEVASLRSALTDFRVATTSLAAAQPTALPVHAPAPRTVFGGMSFQVFAASCATALVLITTSVTLLVPHRSAAPAAPAASPATISHVASESDDALLNGIEQDLSAPVPPSLSPLEIATNNTSTNQQN
jgi:hypothetical protein